MIAASHHISLFTVDNDIYAFSRCPYCERITKNNCDLEIAEHLIEKNVKLFNWNDGDVIE